MIMLICIKQHLSNIWSSIHEKVKQHWVWIEKTLHIKRKRANYYTFRKIPTLLDLWIDIFWGSVKYKFGTKFQFSCTRTYLLKDPMFFFQNKNFFSVKTRLKCLKCVIFRTPKSDKNLSRRAVFLMRRLYFYQKLFLC